MKIRSPWFQFRLLPIVLMSCLSLLVFVTGCSDAIPGAPPPAPSVNISASPAQVSKGSTAMLSVAASNATSLTVTGSDGSSYTLAADGGTLPVNPTTTTTYTATATGPGGTTTATSTVTVAAATAPTVNILASPMSITPGNSSTLTVTATNATAVTVTGSDGSSYTLAATGGTQSVSPSRDDDLYRNRNRSRWNRHFNSDRNCERIDQPSANSDHRSQPHIDLVRRFIHTDCGRDQCHIGNRDRERWQFLHFVGNRRNTIRQSHRDDDIYRDRNWSRRKDLCDDDLTVGSSTTPAPTVTIAANPTSIAPGGSSTLTVAATNATGVTITGSDGSSYTLSATGGTQSVKPTATTTYTATATGTGGKISATRQ